MTIQGAKVPLNQGPTEKRVLGLRRKSLGINRIEKVRVRVPAVQIRTKAG